MNFAVVLVVDGKVTSVLERIATRGAAKALGMEVLVTGSTEDSNDQASTLGTDVLSSH